MTSVYADIGPEPDQEPKKCDNNEAPTEARVQRTSTNHDHCYEEMKFLESIRQASPDRNNKNGYSKKRKGILDMATEGTKRLKTRLILNRRRRQVSLSSLVSGGTGNDGTDSSAGAGSGTIRGKRRRQEQLNQASDLWPRRKKRKLTDLTSSLRAKLHKWAVSVRKFVFSKQSRWSPWTVDPESRIANWRSRCVGGGCGISSKEELPKRRGRYAMSREEMESIFTLSQPIPVRRCRTWPPLRRRELKLDLNGLRRSFRRGTVSISRAVEQVMRRTNNDASDQSSKRFQLRQNPRGFAYDHPSSTIV